MLSNNGYFPVSVVFESAYTGHRKEHIIRLMRYINSQHELHGKYLFILNEQMKSLLGEFGHSNNYAIVYLNFNKKHSNFIKRSFWEWKLVSEIICHYSSLKEIIFLDIDPYLILLTTQRFKRLKLSVRGILFQPYVHFNQQNKGLLFLFKNFYKTYLIQKLAVVLNKEIQKLFIFNDDEAVATLNEQLKKVFYFLPDPIESENAEIDTVTFNGIVKKYKIDKSKKNLLLFGSIDNRKNLINIIDALALLPPSVKSTIHFIIAGSFNDSVRNQYIDYIHKNEHQFSILYFNEFVTDEEREVLFANCDLVLMPYVNFFSSSGILGHAIKNSKNVIVSKSGIVETLVKRHGLGIAVDPFNTEEIKSAIIQLLSENGKMIYNNKEFLEEYSSTNFSKKILLN